MALLLLRIAAAAYVVAAGGAVFDLLRGKDGGERRVMVALVVAVIVHAIAIGGRTVEAESVPISGMLDAISVFCFLAALIALGIASRGGIPQVVNLAAPMLAVIMLAAAVTAPEREVAADLRTIWLAVHISLALGGDAAIAMAGLVSMVYLVQERRVKPKKREKGKSSHHGHVPPRLQKLPALEVLDAMSVRLIKWGFPLLTLGLITGSLYSKHAFGHYWTWDARNTVSLLVWLLYAVMLHARFFVGWRGRRAAILTLVGVIAILLAFMGLGLAGVGVHGKAYLS